MMKLQDYTRFVASLVLVGSAAACGGTTAKSTEAPAADSGAPAMMAEPDASAPPVADTGAADVAPDVDHGSNSSTYPAFKPDIGQIVNNGGTVLTTPQIVTVTWTADPNEATYEQFGDEIGKSKYWSTATSEYGVGVATSGMANHVEIATAPPTMLADTDIAALVTTNTTPTTPPTTSMWPTPNANTLYVLYIPSTTSVLLQGSDACQQGIGGYHDSVTVGTLNVPFGVVLQCTQLAGQGGLVDEATQSASHEIVEAATDPDPNGAPAWYGFDDSDHLSWDIFQQFQDEVGDACELYFDSFYTDVEPAFSFGVQRMWSNKSAAAGHAPCVPTDGTPYYNTTLLEPEAINVDAAAFGMSTHFGTKGIRILKGQTKTFAIGFYSDAPLAPWKITAYEGNPLLGPSGTSNLTVNIDVDQGQNGNKAYVTVKVNSVGQLNAELLSIASGSREFSAHYMPILISSQ